MSPGLIKVVKDRVTKKNKELSEKLEKIRLKKDKEIRDRRDKNQEFLSTKEGMTP